MNAHWLPFVRLSGWGLFVLYLILVGIGRTLQFVVGVMGFVPPDTPPTVDALLGSLALGAWAFGGALLIARQPLKPFGWIFSTMALLFALDEFAFGYAYYGAITQPGALPGVEWMMIWLYWSGRAVALLNVTLLFTLFPTGHPLSPVWGKFLWVNAVAVVVYVVSAAISPNALFGTPFPTDLLGVKGNAVTIAETTKWISYYALVAGAIISTGGLLLRFTRATGIERQQLKWFGLAAVFFVPGIVLLLLGGVTQLNWVFVLGALSIIAMIFGIAVASTIAILRYRLWDVDLIIRRTVTYAIVTTLLLIVFFGSVIFLQAVFARIFPDLAESEIATVLSTLAIAALFAPLRNWIQNAIDRRFNRKKYDAQKVMENFSKTVRDETDLDRLTAELVNVVNETMQPKSVSLWLKREARRMRDEG